MSGPGAGPDLAARFGALWEELAPIGRRPDGGYDRASWTATDAELRAWFYRTAAARSMAVEADPNGNLWAWLPAGAPLTPPATADREGAVLTGSHLDSVPAGGAYDGPLGVVSSFLALDELRRERGDPARPVAVVAWSEEEGGRFGVACLGSKLAAGALPAAEARALTDAGGTTLAEAMAAAGADPSRLGPVGAALGAARAYVELHVEQGRALDPLGAPLGLGSGIWPHGRWRLSFAGRADHAGTAALADRSDPVLAMAAAVVAAREAAAANDALATVGRVVVEPNAANAVAASAEAWLDARAPDEDTVAAVVAAVEEAARTAAAAGGVGFTSTPSSRTPAVEFDPVLRRRIAALLPGVPELATGAGHDAGVLAAVVPTAMLFVRNPTGVSHSPAEAATVADCVAGVRALAAVLGMLAWE